MKTCLECGSQSTESAITCVACGGGSWSDYAVIPPVEPATEPAAEADAPAAEEPATEPEAPAPAPAPKPAKSKR